MNILKYTIHAVSAAALLSLASCSPDVEIKPLPFDISMKYSYDLDIPSTIYLNAVGSEITNDLSNGSHVLNVCFYSSYGYDEYNATVTTTQPAWMQFFAGSNLQEYNDVTSFYFEDDGLSVNGVDSYYSGIKGFMFAPNTGAKREGTLKIDFKCPVGNKTFEVNFVQEASVDAVEPLSLEIIYDADQSSQYAKIIYPSVESTPYPYNVFLLPVKLRSGVELGEEYTPLNSETCMLLARNHMIHAGQDNLLYSDRLPRMVNGEIIFEQPQQSYQKESTAEGVVFTSETYNYRDFNEFSEFVVYTMTFDWNGVPNGFSAKAFTVN